MFFLRESPPPSATYGWTNMLLAREPVYIVEKPCFMMPDEEPEIEGLGIGGFLAPAATFLETIGNWGVGGEEPAPSPYL